MTHNDRQLAIFDLDNTLLGGDSDHAWGEFLVLRNLVDPARHRQQNDQFYADYEAGSLDIDAYLEFALAPIAGMQCAQLADLQRDFLATMIAPMRLARADELLERHRAQGDYLLIITATSDVITHPIAEQLGVDAILSSQAEIIDDRYTGKPTGIPCFQDGKVSRLQLWLEQHPFDLANAWFYSDSHNDLPLLQAVGKPVAVDADSTLQAHAVERGWPTISLR